MISRRSLAAIAAWISVSAAVADVVVMKTGEQITGKVTRFERNEHALASSHFVIEVDGKEEKIPLFKIDTVTLDRAGDGAAPAAVVARPLPAAGLPPARTAPSRQKDSVSEEDSESGEYWLSSTGKRHNSTCRYYKSSKGRPCRAKDGVACKVCGG